MTLKNRHLLLALALSGIIGWSPFSHNISLNSSNWMKNEVNMIESQANNLDPDVLKLSLKAFLNAHKDGLDNKQILTIIDYSKPSNERRLWVIDLKNGKVLFNTWVSHGRNSGKTQATSFSNQPGSLKSSYGVFRTTNETYDGHNGYSLRLKGLEHGVNDKAYERAIVLHGAWYVAPDVVKKYGTLGRSWGCPAVSKELATPLINTIKDDTIIVAYYPDAKWLEHSTFLAG